MLARRRSVDSSSSSGDDSGPKKSRSWFGRKKKHEHQPNHDNHQPPTSPPPLSFPEPDTSMSRPLGFQDTFQKGNEPPYKDTTSPPAYSQPAAPPASGYRLPLSTDSAFPQAHQAGPPPCVDADRSPVYVGSAILQNSVHPCKIAPHLSPACRVPYGGGEYEHNGRYDLLPFLPDSMEWVRTSKGQIPPGRRPIEGGYEENGAKLYHALAMISGVKVPGKTGEHLGGCNVPFGGGEHVVRQGYEILCWK